MRVSPRVAKLGHQFLYSALRPLHLRSSHALSTCSDSSLWLPNLYYHHNGQRQLLAACDNVLWTTIARHQKWPTSSHSPRCPCQLVFFPSLDQNLMFDLLVTSSDVFDGATSSTPVPRAESMKIYQKLPPLFLWDQYEEQFKSWFNTLSPVRRELLPLTREYNISNWWANVLWQT